MKKGKANIELVKQFHWKDFKAMANSAPKRVAYINPAKRIDRNSNFSPCENSNKIHDYYNGTPHAGLRTGKRGWQKLFQQKGNSSNASKESGYLTFRFVINCEGKTGWFTTEEADLDFQPKEFPPELVQHYFDIIEKVDDWRPVVIRQKAADAYAYLTLKLKDGELIDILP